MKHLQMKYNLLHIFFWMTYCAIYGYIAVLLQFKGMSNTLVGVTSGITCALTMFTTPAFSSLVGKVKGLSIKNLITISYVLTVLVWMALILIPMPQIGLLVLFVISGNLCAVNIPLLTMICMNYLTEGHDVNFGLSRGLGSISYATSAVVFGLLIEKFNPTILGWMFVAGAIGVLLDLFALPNVEHKSIGDDRKSLSMGAFILKYKAYIFLLFAITLQFAAATSLATYLINIVKKLGGTTSLYGIAVFFMAASELPCMALVPKLKGKVSTESMLLFASIMYLIRNLVVAMAPSLPILIFGMALQGLSYGVFTAAITYYVHEAIDLEDGMMGQTMIAVMTTGLGSTIGNVFGGVLQDTYGLDAMLLFAEVLSVVGGVLMTVLILGGSRKKRVN